MTASDFPQTSAGLTAFGPGGMQNAVTRVRERACVVQDMQTGAIGAECSSEIADKRTLIESSQSRIIGELPPLFPEWLGDRTFTETHGVRFPYVVGAMANGIASPRLVIAAANAGLLCFLGAAGLAHDRVESALDVIQAALGSNHSWGANLIHSPHEQNLEEQVVNLYLARGVRHVSASAFMSLRPSVVRYAYRGVHVDQDGNIQRPNHLLAKVSRPEVAAAFLRPAPDAMLKKLVADGHLSDAEARLGARLAVAEDITAEADSGGHTDNRPLSALLPVLCSLRNDIAHEQGYERPIRIGAAGGLGDPQAVAAAFAMGAAYVLTGSVNQASVEAGLSDEAKAMLTKAEISDVIMAPAADMFEMGVKLQVLKRGTLFASRAAKLYELYRQYDSLEAIPATAREEIERNIFHTTLDSVWKETHDFWAQREPKQVAKAEQDAHHRMALVFRWYLGKSSRWAIEGDASRSIDYQIWCGPAMGSFNNWVRGSFLEPLENRTAAQIAMNLLEGAAVVTRANQLRSYGVPVPPNAFQYRPRRMTLVRAQQANNRESA